MASAYLTWKESASPGKLETEAIVTSASSYQDAIDALVSDLPPMIGSFTLSDIGRLDRIPGSSNWRTSPIYAINKAKSNNGELASGEFEFSFAPSDRTVKRTFAYETTVYGDSGEITDLGTKNLIGWRSSSKKIEGTDEIEHINGFRWKVAVPFSTASESWRRSVGNLRNSLNEDPFFSYDAKSVIFKSISGNVKADGMYVFDLMFEQMEHQEGVSVGGITVDIPAWSVIDTAEVRMEVQSVDGKNRMVPVVDWVKVHRTKHVKSWSLIADILGMT